MWRFLGMSLVLLALVRPAECRHRKRTVKSAESAESASDQNVLMQHAVKSLLGFEDLPRREAGVVPNPYTTKVAPKYMLDLYQKYKDGRIRTGGLTANTVRSIQSDIGIVNQENLFVLNLTSIGPYESVVKADIHLYKKKMKPEHRSWDIIITAHELAPGNIRELDKLRLSGRTRGWQALDLTPALRRCLGTHQRTNHMLAFSFKLENEAGNQSLLDLREFIQILSRPFLVVFSNDTQNITLDHIDPHFRSEELAGSYVNPENGRREDYSDLDWAGFNQRKRRRRQRKGKKPTGADDNLLSEGNDLSSPSDRVDKDNDLSPPGDREDKDNGVDTMPENSEEEEQEEITTVEDEKQHAQRRRRSIHDNKIPEKPYVHVVTSARYNVPQTHPTILQDRLHSRHQTSNVDGQEVSDNRKRRRRKHRKNKKKDRKKVKEEKDFPAPGPWKELSEKGRNDSPPGGSSGQEVCGKRALVVDFADIGWSDWIISPKSFKAQYCAGSCPFPIAQRLNPSNHATIQSLVHAVGIQISVPAPCCVPDKLSSVTLLFFDVNNNVVLKNYPGMTVESCACR